jgi:hypothetical protein
MALDPEAYEALKELTMNKSGETVPKLSKVCVLLGGDGTIAIKK